MKVRKSFVSNSSSCSFMLVGIPCSETGKTLQEIYEIDERNELHFADVGSDIYVGYLVSRMHDDEYGVQEVTPVHELVDFQRKIEALFPGAVASVIAGREAC